MPACALFERPWCLGPCAPGLAEMLAASVGIVPVVAKTCVSDAILADGAADVVNWLVAVVDEEISVNEISGVTMAGVV